MSTRHPLGLLGSEVALLADVRVEVEEVRAASLHDQLPPSVAHGAVPEEPALGLHDADIIDPVWALYEETAKRFGPVSTMIERDGNIPPLDALIDELEQARQIAGPYYQPIPYYQDV